MNEKKPIKNDLPEHIPEVYLYVITEKKLFTFKFINSSIDAVKKIVKSGMAEKIWEIENTFINPIYIVSCEVKQA